MKFQALITVAITAVLLFAGCKSESGDTSRSFDADTDGLSGPAAERIDWDILSRKANSSAPSPAPSPALSAPLQAPPATPAPVTFDPTPDPAADNQDNLQPADPSATAPAGGLPADQDDAANAAADDDATP